MSASISTVLEMVIFVRLAAARRWLQDVQTTPARAESFRHPHGMSISPRFRYQSSLETAWLSDSRPNGAINGVDASISAVQGCDNSLQ